MWVLIAGLGISTSLANPAQEAAHDGATQTDSDASSQPEKGTKPAVEATSSGQKRPVGDVDVAAHRKGFQLYGGLGLKTCIPDGAADCSNTYPGTFISTGMEYRFWYLGIALDFDLGRYLVAEDDDFDVSSLSMHLMPVLKAYYPLKSLDVFVGFGMGYGQQWVTEDSSRSEASWTTFWRAMKVTAGVGLDLEPYGLPAGFTLDLNADLLMHSGGTRCAKYGGAGPCLDEKDLKGGQNDVADQIRLGSALRYSF
ncbi:MAG: hypothetical protein CMH52_06825 [Myxococcales bacterium]|nr:hypothetical protein [Myxococcales bacterium]